MACWFARRMAAILKQYCDTTAKSSYQAEPIANLAAFVDIWVQAYQLWLQIEHNVRRAEKQDKLRIADEIENTFVASILKIDIQHHSTDSSQKARLCKSTLSAMAFLVYSYFRCKRSGNVSVQSLIPQTRAEGYTRHLQV